MNNFVSLQLPLFLVLLYSQCAVGSAGNVLTFPLLHEDSVKERILLESENSSSSSSASQRRQLMRQKASPQTIPMYQGYGTFYVDIYVGSPRPQRQTVFVDTGSESIGFPCSGCIDCGDAHTDEHFDPLQSDTFHQLTCSECYKGKCSFNQDTCHVRSSYVEGSSWTGSEVQDYIYPGGPHDEALNVVDKSPENDDDDAFSGANPENAVKYRFPLKFTCMESNDSAFKDQLADGIMGLGLKKASFWRQMYNEGAIEKQQFSMCLRKHPFTPLTARTRAVGVLTLGGVDDRLQSSDMIFMDYTDSNNGLYNVHIRRIYVHPSGGQRLAGDSPDVDLSRGGTFLVDTDESIIEYPVVLDSGTTDTILPADLKPALDQIWEQMMSMPFPTEPISISPEELRGWPTIIFQMKGSPYVTSTFDLTKRNGKAGILDEQHPDDVLVAFPPSHYMMLDPTTKEYLPRLKMHDDYGGSILGQNFMRGHNILFDVDNRQIGIAESDCDYEYLVTGEPIEFIDPYASIEELTDLIRQGICEARPMACQLEQIAKILGCATWAILTFMIVGSVFQMYNGHNEECQNEEGDEYKEMHKLLIKNSGEF